MKVANSKTPAASVVDRKIRPTDPRGFAVASSHGMNDEVIGTRSDTAAQFRPQFLRDMMSVQAVANNLRTNEDDELRPRPLLVLVRERVSQPLNFVQQWNSVAV